MFDIYSTVVFCVWVVAQQYCELSPLNLLSPKSDQYQNSPCDINAFYNRLVMRIKAMIAQDTMS